ncbi:MAG: AAA family ATPase [candidate division WOR-3 bacterium]|nr:AAA family ATPase [candidate division WOR-3 bacterium]MDW8150361.1 AAA family ATPase [candidate division WOR-3 bacterium]
MRERIFQALEELIEQPIKTDTDEIDILNYKIIHKFVKNKHKLMLVDKTYPHLLPVFILELDEKGLFRGYYRFSDMRNFPISQKPFLRYTYKTDKYKFLRTIQPYKDDISIFYLNGRKFENGNLEEFFERTLFPSDVFENKTLIIEIFYSNKVNREIFKNFRILQTLKFFAIDLESKLKKFLSELELATTLRFKPIIGYERLYAEIEEGALFLSRIYDRVGYLLHFRPKTNISDNYINKSQQYVLNFYACNSDYSDGTIKSYENDPYLPNWSLGIMHVFEDNLELVNKEIEKFLTLEISVIIKTKSEYAELLEKYKNVIFYGPPGTGKTYMAIKVANEIAPRNYYIVQLHPSYSYEEFLEGIRPHQDGGFYIKDGIFKKICKRALENPSKKFVVILDEISRANIIQVFGELLYALEYRNNPVILPYSSESFVIPENVYIIGTMNTADRSVHALDIALRRRFIFIKFAPDFNVIEKFYREKGYEDKYLERIREFFKEINDNIISKRLGEEFLIGHSYFLVEPNDLKDVIQRKILPVLRSLLSEKDYNYVLNFIDSKFNQD